MPMNIRLTQTRERIKDATEKLAKRGMLPDLREVAALAKSLEQDPGNPTIVPIDIADRNRFPESIALRFTKNLTFDLRVLRGVLLDYYQDNKKEFIKNRTRHQKMLKDIADIKAQLDQLINIGENEITDCIVEPFTDTENVATKNKATVDLSYGQAVLARKPFLSKRLLLPRLRDFAPDVDILGPNVQRVLSSGPIFGSSFFNAMDDSSTVWIHRIVTNDYNADVQIVFTIPINRQLVSRFTMEPHSDTPMLIKVEHTVDGEVFVNSGVDQTTEGQELQWRFERNNIEAFRVSATIRSAPFIRQGLSEYMFGFRMIGAFNDTYESRGTITTDFYTPILNGVVSAVELIADEDIPDGTDIQYSIVARPNSGSDTSALSISPLNRFNKESPSRIEISGTSHFRGPISNQTPTETDEITNIKFFDIGTVDEDHRINPRTAKLFRGLNAWNLTETNNVVERETETRVDLRTDKDARLFFYLVEEARFISKDIISVSHFVDFNEDGQELRPRGNDNISPNAAIASIIRKTFGEPIGFGAAGSGPRFFVSTGAEFPTLQPANVTETVTNPIVTPQSVVTSQGTESFIIDTKPEEQVIILYADGTRIQFSLTLRKRIVLDAVTQDETGVFSIIDPDVWSLDSTTDIHVLDDDGTVLQFDISEFIETDITVAEVTSIIFNSLKAVEQPENTGHESDSFFLIPNKGHITQAPDMFKANEVDDLKVPFPVKIVTPNFSGVYEVDRVTNIELDGVTTPVLVIVNPTRLGGTIPKAIFHKVTAWEIVSQDLTSELDFLDDDQLHFTDEVTINIKDVIEVKYRVAADSGKIEVLPETIRVLDSQTGAVFEEGRDFKYVDGAIHSLKEDSVRDLVVVYTYREQRISLHKIVTYLRTTSQEAVQLKIAKFGESTFAPDKDAGELVKFDEQDLRIDSIISVAPGWHKITIKAKDLNRMLLFIAAVDSEGRRIFNISDVFDRMLAFIDPLTFVDKERLFRSTRLANPKHFTIIDNCVTVPFDPTANAFTNNRIYNVFKNEDMTDALEGSILKDPALIPAKKEEFDIEYDYVKQKDGEIEDVLMRKVRVNITMSRSLNKNSSLTPTLKAFKLRIM